MAELPERIPDEQLAQIRQRHEAARLGPWYLGQHSAVAELLIVNCHGEQLGKIQLDPDELAFVIAARMDVPALLTEVDRLTASLGIMGQLHMEAEVQVSTLLAERDEWEAANG